MHRRLRLPRPIRLLSAALLALAVTALPATAANAQAPAAPAATEGLQYVALGDSYSAGFGLEPFSFSTPADGCFQAEQNYPHQVAARLGLELDDRTCSGAVTANIRDTPQPTITGLGTAPVQSQYLTADTDVVTVTIGGNDLGFADVAAFCVSLGPGEPILGDPLYTDCSDYYHPLPEVDLLADKIDDVVAPALASTYALIAEKAPNAKVIVVGYPTLSPDVENVPAAGCFTPALTPGGPPYPENSFPYTAADTTYLHDVEAKLDAAIRENAEAAGATYLSTLPQTESHSACQTDGSAFVNGISLLFDQPNQGTPTPDPDLFVKLGALHPNAAGVAFLTDQVAAAVTAAVGEGTVGEEDGGGTPPQAIGDPDGGASSAATADDRQLAASGADPVPSLAVAAGLLAAAGAILIGVRIRALRESAEG
ncbi:SGNH/GDSL hydrolase family protein [Herbiconiux sp. UC225_62]|uniref:SGNH/GDSL hydrolase family protein n=1 Tax=Herbiconiux sp. UC225_62 TaxID=3350168 RepID=UPI0036D2A4F2